jgi:fluoride exporter
VTLPVLLAVGAVGGLGAIARFLLDGAVGRRLGRELPLGTLAVNLSGAFVLGVLAGAALSADAYRIVATGFVGAYTTFSTWMLESHRLGEDGRLAAGAVNVALSLLAGLAAVWAGRHVGTALLSR